ncbi:hypothetical protein [Tardiphaga robiniae]|nr:hypothetical protein [Tardiphaga robiniae]
MRHPDIPHSVLQGVQLTLRDPAGLVCAALILALIAVAIRIASVW